MDGMTMEQLRSIHPASCQLIPIDDYARWCLVHFPERIATKADIVAAHKQYLKESAITRGGKLENIVQTAERLEAEQWRRGRS